MLTPSKGNVHISPSADTEEAAGYSINFIKEGLTEHVEFPLLFESSAFQTNPILADVNGDAILDAILTDYHGGLYAIGLQVAPDKNHRYFFKAQVPRMYVRRQWVEAMVNETLGIDPYEAEKLAEEEERRAEEERKAAREAAVAAGGGDGEPIDETSFDRDQFHANDDRPHDPYHSYFEYSYGSGNTDHETILRGVTANVLKQDLEHVQGLDERRNRNHYPKVDQNQKVVHASSEEDENTQKVVYDSFEEDEKNQKIIYDSFEEDEKSQKVVYDSAEEMEADHRRLQEVVEGGEETSQDNGEEFGSGDDFSDWGEFADDMQRTGDDIIAANNKYDDDILDREEANEINGDGKNLDQDDDKDVSFVSRDDDYPRYDDYSHRYGMHDDFYQGRYSDLYEDYFDDKHYIRLPPHILCTPVLAEMPKLYSNNGETENLLFVAVSYYFDEDEYEGFFSYKRFANSDHGDETETQRGMYVANAIMIFHLGDNPRWGK